MLFEIKTAHDVSLNGASKPPLGVMCYIAQKPANSRTKASTFRVQIQNTMV